jgi:uncharacterized protein YbjT (DUF2867 family)
MRLVVAGGTGCVGRFVVEAARGAGHEVGVISRATGTDLVSGTGLAEALQGADAVIDVSNYLGVSRSKSMQFFATATGNLLAAGAKAGVGHHVALSIVGIDRVPLGYYAGKLRQEEVLAGGDVPWTVLRATQFHEFPAQFLARLKGPLVAVPRMRSATVAAREVAEHLLELAAGPAMGRAPDLAGPQVHQMADLIRRLVRALGQRRLVLPVRLPGRAGAGMAGGGLLPTGAGPRGRQTFDEWLAEYVTAR